MASTLVQIIEQERLRDELVEAEKSRIALLREPPEGKSAYLLTRDFYDSQGSLFRQGSVLFFREGEAPRSAHKLEADDAVVAETIADTSVSDFEARKEKQSRIQVEVVVDGQKNVLNDVDVAEPIVRSDVKPAGVTKTPPQPAKTATASSKDDADSEKK